MNAITKIFMRIWAKNITNICCTIVSPCFVIFLLIFVGNVKAELFDCSSMTGESGIKHFLDVNFFFTRGIESHFGQFWSKGGPQFSPRFLGVSFLNQFNPGLIGTESTQGSSTKSGKNCSSDSDNNRSINSHILSSPLWLAVYLFSLIVIFLGTFALTWIIVSHFLFQRKAHGEACVRADPVQRDVMRSFDNVKRTSRPPLLSFSGKTSSVSLLAL